MKSKTAPVALSVAEEITPNMNVKHPDRLYKSDRMNYIVSRMRVDQDITPALLAEELNVSERTVYRDLRYLENGNALKKRYSRREGRYLLETELTLSPVKLTPSEALAMHNAACNPALAEDNFFSEDLRSGLEKIGAALDPIVMPSAEDLQPETPAVQQFSLDSIQRPTMEVLRRAIHSNRKVRLLYWSPSSDSEREVVAAPYDLRETDQGWYLLANSEASGGIRPFKVGRIRDVEILTDRFRFPRRFDVDVAFAQSWEAHGYADNDVVVQLRFSPEVAELVGTYPLHPFVEIKPQSDGSLSCTARVPSVREITWWILAHGSGVEVLGPVELRMEFARLTQEMAAVYSLSAPLPEPSTDRVVSSALLVEALADESILRQGAVVLAKTPSSPSLQ